MGFIESFFANLAIPFEVANVFSKMRDIFDALPLVVQFAIVGCFALSCLFAILRILL